MVWSSDSKSAGRGGRRRGSFLSEGPLPPPHLPLLPPPNRFTHLVPSALMMSSYMSYSICYCIFGLSKNDRRSPFSHLCLIFVYNFLIVFLLFAPFPFIGRQQQERQGGGRRRGPSSGSHMGLSGAERAIQRTPSPPPTPTRHIPDCCKFS